MDSACPLPKKGKTLIVARLLWNCSQHMDVGVTNGCGFMLMSLSTLNCLSPLDLHGYMTSHGLPDCPRSARYILKDYVNVRFLEIPIREVSSFQRVLCTGFNGVGT